MDARERNGRFVKGHPGNKQAPGRPPIARSLSEAIRVRGFVIVDPKTGDTRNDKLADGLWDIALNHTDAALRLKALDTILDRTEGKPTQRVEIRRIFEEIAQANGLDVDELIAEAEAIMAGVHGG